MAAKTRARDTAVPKTGASNKAQHDTPRRSLPRQSTSSHSTSRHGARTIAWHKTAPGAVRRAFAAGDIEQGWAAWSSYLATRDTTPDLVAMVTPGLPKASNPLDWGLLESLTSCPIPPWLKDAANASPDDLVRWCDVSPVATKLAKKGPTATEPTATGPIATGPTATGPTAMGLAEYALERLAVAWALPKLAERLPADAWASLLHHLLAVVDDATSLARGDAPLAEQILAGELASTLAHLFPEITACRKLPPSARRVVSAGLVDLLDGEGLPHARHVELIRPLLACWTRCLAIGRQRKQGGCNAEAMVQYEWLTRQALQMTRHDGSPVFTDRHAAAFRSGDRTTLDLFKAALWLGDDEDNRRIATHVLPRLKDDGSESDDKESRDDAVSEAAMHSEWAAMAVLRADWDRATPRLTVGFVGQTVRMELGCGKDVLWSGNWEFDAWSDGCPLLPTNDWEEVCSISDDDVDYLELEIALEGGRRLQRQILLARDDRFLLLADCLLGETRGRLDYRGRLPLDANVAFRPAEPSREGFLVGSKRRALVLPLALPEWRAEPGVGELTVVDGCLQLEQASDGCGLYAPLFFDLDRRRQTRTFTWRQLTVAASLAVQPPDVAVGYRVLVGGRQWLIYRSLAEKANRTLLGHNLSTEAVVARFDAHGEVEPLLEIE